MDKRLARRNLRTGISMFLMIIALLGATFAWAAIYLNAVK